MISVAPIYLLGLFVLGVFCGIMGCVIYAYMAMAE